MQILRIRDFVSGAPASLNGALEPPRVGQTVRLQDVAGRECDGFVRAVARVPHDPRGSHWEIDVEPSPSVRGTPLNEAATRLDRAWGLEAGTSKRHIDAYMDVFEPLLKRAR